MLLLVNLFHFQIYFVPSFCTVHCIPVSVLVRQGPPENQLLAEEAFLLNIIYLLSPSLTCQVSIVYAWL